MLRNFQEAGIGYSGPANIGDRLYTLDDRGEKECLIALDIKNVTDGTFSSSPQRAEPGSGLGAAILMVRMYD